MVKRILSMVKRILLAVLIPALFCPGTGVCQRFEDMPGFTESERDRLRSIRQDQQDRELREYQERSIQLQQEQNDILRGRGGCDYYGPVPLDRRIRLDRPRW